MSFQIILNIISNNIKCYLKSPYPPGPVLSLFLIYKSKQRWRPYIMVAAPREARRGNMVLCVASSCLDL